jgi:hypothetical protein
MCDADAVMVVRRLCVGRLGHSMLVDGQHASVHTPAHSCVLFVYRCKTRACLCVMLR